MTSFLRRYGVLMLSLAALFASGVMIGRVTAPAATAHPATTATTTTTAKAPQSWLESASHSLKRELLLSPDQETALRAPLEAASVALREDQERALFQMHLRLLVLHDSMAQSGVLHADQTRKLAESRAKLKRLIVAKFPAMVRSNPKLAEGS